MKKTPAAAPQPPSNSNKEFEKEMGVLRQFYLKRISEHMVEMIRLRELIRNNILPQGDAQKLYQATHNFCGSGATFGFPKISETARELHNAVKAWMGADRNSKQILAEQENILEKLALYEQACREAIDGKSGGTEDKKPPAAAPSAVRSDAIAIFAGKAELARRMTEQLEHFSYAVLAETDPVALGKKIEAEAPMTLLIYSDLSPSDISLIQPLIQRWKEIVKGTSNLIFISSVDSYESRLSSVHLGAEGYFTEDADILKIIEKIAQMVSRWAVPSYNILVVDDDEMLAEFYSYTLKNAGLRSLTVSNPKDCLKVLAGQDVDLVMIDFAMPHCNGQELAAIIRQYESYVGLPIIFMSARKDIESLLIDTGLGIDDFLVKPFTPEHLISVVRSRARRAADLRALMVRDSFTGLLNHANFLEALSTELSYVRRTGRKTAYAMIDIDHFKNVNDTYGHAAGDQVIKGLSRLLQQRLRQTDIIGRCGGEEFGIILPDCKIEEAKRVLETMLQKFSEISHLAEAQDIRVTFSAGISMVEGDNVKHLIAATDAALYKAKKEGRSRIIIAGNEGEKT